MKFSKDYNKMEKEIQLGDKVKCKYTGFIGIATMKTEFINGCIQIGVIPRVGKENKIPEEIGIDSQSLIIISRGEKGKEIDKLEKDRIQEIKEQIIESLEEKPTGGPITRGLKMRGY